MFPFTNIKEIYLKVGYIKEVIFLPTTMYGWLLKMEIILPGTQMPLRDDCCLRFEIISDWTQTHKHSLVLAWSVLRATIIPGLLIRLLGLTELYSRTLNDLSLVTFLL